MRIKITFFSLSLLFYISVFAQKSDYSIPKSIELRLNDDQSLKSSKKVFPALNLSTLKREDENDERNGLPPRFGYPLDVNFNPKNSGNWKALPNGDRIWRLEIECANAKSINLLYDKFWLADGAKFYIYSKNKSQIIGGFTSENNRGTRQNPSKFTTGLIFSQSIVLELFEPVAIKNQSILSVDKIVYGYREIDLKNMMTEDFGHGDSGPCQVNINCPEGQNWQNEKKGVALILVNGVRWCSGSLVNNTSNDQTPYFLTADHCIGSLDANGDTDASYYSFWWNYESSTCSQNSVDFIAESTSGATLVANNSATDFALFELTESPLDNNLDVYFNGWDRTTNPTQGGVGIHHPQGDFKKIATFNNAPISGQAWGTNYWRVIFEQTQNGHSISQGGSSGAPIFQGNGKIIGQIRGSHPGDCNALENEFCEFGRFDISWDGASPQRRLRDWLDPINLNPNYLDAMGSIGFQNDIDIVCYSGSITLSLTRNQNPVTWQTSTNINILSSNNSSITIRASSSNASGNGWVKATLNNGTVLQDDFWVGKPSVNVPPIPDICINLRPLDTFVLPISDGAVEYRLSWTDSNLMVNVPNGSWFTNVPRDLFFTASRTGTYYVSIQTRNPCGTTSSQFPVRFTFCPTGGRSMFAIYPNPTSTDLTIEKLEGTETHADKISAERTNVPLEASFELYNFGSELVLYGQLKHLTTIAVSKLKKGTYILKIHTNGNTETHQIIIK